MKALIIDDEKRARNLLERILIDTCSAITSIYKATDLESGIELIKKEAPGIVFLDIEMPRYSGLQILDFFKDEEIKFQIIFVTAYDNYAIEAFKLSAVDYLLKPINIKELKLAVDKAITQQEKNHVNTTLNDLRKSFQQLALNTIALEIPKGIIFVSYDDILYLEADGMYSKVYMRDGRVELISKPLKYFSDQLSESPFFYKSHRSYLINLKHIKQFVKQDGGYLIMKDDKNIPIAKNKKEDFLKCVEDLF